MRPVSSPNLSQGALTFFRSSFPYTTVVRGRCWCLRRLRWRRSATRRGGRPGRRSARRPRSAVALRREGAGASELCERPAHSEPRLPDYAARHAPPRHERKTAKGFGEIRCHIDDELIGGNRKSGIQVAMSQPWERRPTSGKLVLSVSMVAKTAPRTQIFSCRPFL